MVEKKKKVPLSAFCEIIGCFRNAAACFCPIHLKTFQYPRMLDFKFAYDSVHGLALRSIETDQHLFSFRRLGERGLDRDT